MNTPARNPRVAIFAGSFDPVTNGHLDLMVRAVLRFERLIVAVLVNPRKPALFTLDERVALLRSSLDGAPDAAKIAIETYDGLLVDFARARGAGTLIRGLRGSVDADYEIRMALMNRHLAPDLETMFLTPSPQYTYVSSSLVREIAALGGPLAGLVPPAVEARFRARRNAEGSQRV